MSISLFLCIYIYLFQFLFLLRLPLSAPFLHKTGSIKFLLLLITSHYLIFFSIVSAIDFLDLLLHRKWIGSFGFLLVLDYQLILNLLLLLNLLLEPIFFLFLLQLLDLFDFFLWKVLFLILEFSNPNDLLIDTLQFHFGVHIVNERNWLLFQFFLQSLVHTG